MTFAMLMLLAGPDDLLQELASDAPESARARILAMGKDAVPMLRQAMASDSKILSRRAMELLARITGQWGSTGGILWKRSLEEAKQAAAAARKPILLLQLFGRLDEEFC